jgi:tetratricopeptide (TPR) repeat protein
MKILSRSIFFVAATGLVACSDINMGDTTTMATATGGALGAGLGAIVGSQTGTAGGGLVLGALAGSAAGYTIGNALEGQEKIIRTQDEAIERHERTISAQRTELEEIRRMNQEPGSSLGAPSGYVPHASLGRVESGSDRFAPAPSANRWSNPPAREIPTQEMHRAAEPVREATIVDHSADYQLNHDIRANTATTLSQKQGARFESPALDQRGMAVGANTGALEARVNEAKTANLNTPECIQAEGEVGKARESGELADKLFHFRRALRLCPENPAYHNGLGEVYVSLNRRSDAEFEFREALNLNPNFQPAANNLNSLR